MYYSRCRKALGQCCPYEMCQVRKEAALSLICFVLQVIMNLTGRDLVSTFFIDVMRC